MGFGVADLCVWQVGRGSECAVVLPEYSRVKTLVCRA